MTMTSKTKPPKSSMKEKEAAKPPKSSMKEKEAAKTPKFAMKDPKIPSSSKTPKSPMKEPEPKPKSKDPDSSNSNPNHKRKARDLDEEDAVSILKAVIKFKSDNHGSTPTPTTIAPLYDAVKPSLHADLSRDQLYNRIRSLKKRYHRARDAGTAGPTSSDQVVFDLSVKVWGDKDEGDRFFDANGSNSNSNKKKKKLEEEKMNDDGMEDLEEEEKEEKEGGGGADSKEVKEEKEGGGGGADSFKCLSEHGMVYFKSLGLSVENLELGVKKIDKSKAAALEQKWRQHFGAGLKLMSNSFEVKRELFTALVAVNKGKNT